MRPSLNKYKPQKIYRPSIYFLNEIASIPVKVRIDYLQSFAASRRFEHRKIVGLIRIIYKYIDTDSIMEWNPWKICVQLDISNLMLRYYKHLIITGLRERYYGWDNHNKQIEIKYRNEPEEIKQFERAKKMFEIGMRQEAKTILIRVYKIFEGKYKNVQTLLILSEIYHLLLHYYYYQNNLNLYNQYLNRLHMIYQRARSSKTIHQKEVSLVAARYYIALAQKQNFNQINDTAKNEIIKSYTTAYKYSKNASAYEYTLNILLKLAHSYLGFKKISKARNLLEYALRLSRLKKLDLHHLLIKAELAYLDFVIKKDTSSYNVIKKCYTSFKKKAPNHNLYMILMIKYFNIHVHVDNRRIKDIINEMLVYSYRYPAPQKALLLEYYTVVTTGNYLELYLVKSDNGEFVRVKSLNYKVIDRAEKIILNMLNQSRKLSPIDCRLDLYVDYLFIEFLKGKNCDFKKAHLIVQKINWLRKTRSFQMEHYDFNLIEIFLKMLEKINTEDKKTVFLLYKRQITSAIEDAFQNHSVSINSIYILVAYMSKLLNYKEMWEVSNNLYLRLQKNYKKEMAYLLEDL